MIERFFFGGLAMGVIALVMLVLKSCGVIKLAWPFVLLVIFLLLIGAYALLKVAEEASAAV